MKNRRQKCLVVLASIIVLGILSRKLEFVPLCIGDILYGSMIFFIVRFILVNSNLISVTMKAVIVCFGIEFLQLYQGDWMLTLRNTLLGRYVLGTGFLWMDLLWYTIGIGIAVLTEKMILKSYKKLN